ncbi:hypothetical protein E2562_036572 [Oryza meyeriana var. granulata]|uniref:Uncharacterized protein n=1 Tax=Oryza meyeriana var. granulata TaxID=110450 RepID=A0A6G1ECZ3_9ORYZ|nr:hypothetical protein E2562_036572 [Oryza meyeriana var. granulata]
MAETRLSSAISEAQIAVRAHRLYKQLPSPRQGVRRREAWKVEKNVSTAIGEVVVSLVAVRRMRDAVVAEEQIVRDAIDAAGPRGPAS